jgi:methylated-DNA-[protein]-cysteine S-methyltransferase
LLITGTKKQILSVNFTNEKIPTNSNIPLILKKCLAQLDEYFKGRRKNFFLNLKLGVTKFQQKVWRQILKIPFGKTATYANIAKAINNRNSRRAVGNACSKNKIAIIIPCHRVIKNNGDLSGYSSGVWRKQWLVNFEKAEV